MADSGQIAIGGNPNVQVSYSLINKEFIIRDVILRSGLSDFPVGYCGLNRPEDKCVTVFACTSGVSLDLDEDYLVLSKNRATEKEVVDALKNKIGQKIKVLGGGACLNPGVRMFIITSASYEGVSAAGWGWGNSDVTVVPPPPETDPKCIVNDSTGKVEIKYGVVESTKAHGSVGRALLNLRCEQDAAMKITMNNELTLQTGLSAMLYFKKSGADDNTKVAGAYGIAAGMWNGETTSIEVMSTLKVTGTLQGGPFEGSTVIKLEYF